MRKLYVGNLSYRTGEAAMTAAFQKYTPVSVRIIKDKFSGESRGFGFIEIESGEQADAALAEMNGYSLDGKALKVNEARSADLRSAPGRFHDDRLPARGAEDRKRRIF